MQSTQPRTSHATASVCLRSIQLHADVLGGTYRWFWYKGIENLLLDV